MRFLRRLAMIGLALAGSTAFQGDPVSFTATFKTLRSGLNHVAFAELTVPATQLSVQVHNFDYNRNN